MRVLILHASAGAGHARAAAALAKAFMAEDELTEVVVSDLLDYTPSVFRRTYAKGYLRVVRRAPELWGYMYSRSDTKATEPWRKKVRSTFNKVNVIKFVEFLKNFRPDVAVCTHFMPLEVLSTRAKEGKVDFPFFACVTDFAVHSLWIMENVDCYYVATEEARRQLRRRGLPERHIGVTGIPIDPVFADIEPRHEVRKRLKLKPDLPVVLIMSGGMGVGAAPDIVAAFKGHELKVQLVVVSGASEELRDRVEAAAEGLKMPIRIYGRVKNIHELMDASDMVITKSGGLTSSEALAKQVPMLITDPIPGQEQRNCEHLLEDGAAVRLYEAEDAPDRIRLLLEDPAKLKQMRAQAKRVGNPHAARDIVRDITSRLG